MIGWGAVLLAGLAVFAIKLAGHLAPPRLLERPDVMRAAALLTAGLLAALVAVQTVAESDHLAVDSRLPALLVAALALWRKAPFFVVVLLAARVVTAMGVAMSISLGIAIGAASARPERRGQIIGVLASFTAAGQLAGRHWVASLWTSQAGAACSGQTSLWRAPAA